MLASTSVHNAPLLLLHHTRRAMLAWLCRGVRASRANGRCLAPGGRLLLASFAWNIADAEYLTTCREWCIALATFGRCTFWLSASLRKRSIASSSSRIPPESSASPA